MGSHAPNLGSHAPNLGNHAQSSLFTLAQFHPGKARVAGQSEETQIPYSGWCDVPALPHLVDVKDSARKKKQKQNKETNKTS